MAKTLTFVDGTTYDFTDSSTVTKLVAVVSSFAEIDELFEKFTSDNLNGGDFDGEKIKNIVVIGVEVPTVSADSNITAYFVSRAKTELELLKESQALQNEVLDALLMAAE